MVINEREESCKQQEEAGVKIPEAALESTVVITARLPLAHRSEHTNKQTDKSSPHLLCTDTHVCLIKAADTKMMSSTLNLLPKQNFYMCSCVKI